MDKQKATELNAKWQEMVRQFAEDNNLTFKKTAGTRFTDTEITFGVVKFDEGDVRVADTDSDMHLATLSETRADCVRAKIFIGIQNTKSWSVALQNFYSNAGSIFEPNPIQARLERRIGGKRGMFWPARDSNGLYGAVYQAYDYNNRSKTTPVQITSALTGKQHRCSPEVWGNEDSLSIDFAEPIVKGDRVVCFDPEDDEENAYVGTVTGVKSKEGLLRVKLGSDFGTLTYKTVNCAKVIDVTGE